MSLQCRVVAKDPGSPQAYLSGAIDENAPLEKIFADLAAAAPARMTVFMQGINRVNSIGVRNWVREITDFTRNRPVRIEGLSYPLAMQANSVANLMGSAEIASCMAPYFCSLCEANRMVLVTRADCDASAAPPAKACADCGSAMEFDEVDEYVYFLRRP
jgi:hypothetical protein